MDQSLGRGPFGSLRSQVEREIAALFRQNATLRGARYSARRHLLRSLIVNRSAGELLALYTLVLLLMVGAEWALNRYAPDSLPGYHGNLYRGFITEVGSYLIAGQVGVLAIVSVAVGVVTLLSDRSSGASVNTDIRLYYVESYSYEVATSGVTLLLVLIVQLFWPLQHLLHAAGLGGRDVTFKLALTGVHATWFCFNTILFLQFITTTLRFVEPSSRERLRERYVANEIIPDDVAKRLLSALYLTAPERLLGKDELKKGPQIAFGRIAWIPGNSIVEITYDFRRSLLRPRRGHGAFKSGREADPSPARAGSGGVHIARNEQFQLQRTSGILRHQEPRPT